MPVRTSLAGVKRLGSAKVTIATATTTSFDFGTPDDIKLLNNSSYRPGDRILAIFTASTAGTTNTLAFVVQDAPDSSGSIGSTATAVTTALGSDSLAAATGDRFCAVAVTVQSGRPWLRFRVTSNGNTDTFVCHCTVFSVPKGGV